jgi:pilus assembly protein CpaE
MTHPLLRVLIIEDSVVAAEALQELLHELPEMQLLNVSSTGQDGIRRAAELRPDVVLMDIHLPDIDGVDATRQITAGLPGTTVIVITSEDRPEFMQRAMLAGARGYLIKPVRSSRQLADTIRSAVEQVASTRVDQTSANAGLTAGAVRPQRGRRIALFSPKGGQGKTTIGINLAVTLQGMPDTRVLFVDGDLRFGDASVMLDLKSELSIIDLVPHIDNLDTGLLDQVVAKHPSGLHVLVRPERPELAETILPHHLAKLLTVTPRLYDYTVIDTDVSYEDRPLTILDHADVILLVITPNLGVVRNAKRFLELALALGYPRERMYFLINRANSHVGFGPEDVQRVLGPGRYLRLDSQGRLLTANLNLGQPTVLAHPRSEFTRTIQGIADTIRMNGESREPAPRSVPRTLRGLFARPGLLGGR